jgi:uncharacterized RDD family membrane protein YckC
MKCSKCGYIEFESGARCRNCGNDFSFALAESREQELPVRGDGDVVLPDDLDMLPSLGGRDSNADQSDFELDRLLQLPKAGGSDLPLFEQPDFDSSLLPASPRPPLAVRRATPPATRMRGRPAGRETREPELPIEDPSVERDERRPKEPARAGQRAWAALIDACILAVMDGTVLYLTLRLSELPAAQVGQLPMAPFIGFLMVLNAGYLVFFTATAGQTIGKMAVRIRVVGLDERRIDFGTAIARALVSLLSLLPAGLGLLPALVGRHRRALHDHLAGTRVVRVPSR